MMFRAACLAVLLSSAAHAHGAPPAPAHGGIVAEGSGEHWVELLAAGDTITVWVSDEDRKPIPSGQLGGKATVLAGGKTQVVSLAPGAGDSLSGTLAAAPAGGTVTTVLALTAGGKPVQVRFAAPKP